MIRSIPGDLERSTGMHFPDLWYFESVLRSWINANVFHGEPVFAGSQWHEEWAVPGLIVYNSVRSSAYNELHCYTDTLSFRNVSMRRHLVKFAATVAANLVQTLAWNQNPNCSLFDPIEEFTPIVARDFS